MILQYVIKTGILHWLLSGLERFLMGCLPNAPDARDWVYIPRSSAALSGDLTRHLVKNFYQGPVGSCTVHGAYHAMLMEEHRLGIRKPTPSRRYAYWWARYYNEMAPPAGLEGCSIRNGFRAVRNKGAPPESLWKYSHKAKVLNRQPTGKVSLAGRSRLGYNYAFLPMAGSRAVTIRQAITDGHPVVFGADISADLRNATGRILFPPRPSAVIGKHCMCVIAYEKDYFVVLNSWRGREFVKLHESYFESNRVFDLAVWLLDQED